MFFYYYYLTFIYYLFISFRVAGNVVDPVALGSIEYAVEHLHSPLIVVLGHQKCGAVKAGNGFPLLYFEYFFLND